MASNKIKGLTVEIGGDTTKLGKALEDVNKKGRDLSSELGEINKLLKFDPGNADLLAQKQKVLAEAVSNTAKKLETLEEAERQVQEQFKRGEVSEEQVRALQREIIDTTKRLEGYERAAKETADAVDKLGDKSDDAAKEIDDVADSADKAEKESDDLGSTLDGSLSKGFTAVAAVAAAASAAIVGCVEASHEYRTAMGKLDTAFTTNNHSRETAKKTYKELQSVLGETDQAVEAANHLAQLANSEEDLTAWTEIATGVYGTFGDSLPIEGLTEAANETAKTGQVTGALADALNWAAEEGETFGVELKQNIDFTELSAKELENLTDAQREEYEARKEQYEAIEEYNKGVEEAVSAEDMFNIALANCTDEQERQKLITDTLTKKYKSAATQYKKTNKEVIEANKANEEWNETMAELGEEFTPVVTEIKKFGTELLKNAKEPLKEIAGFLTDKVLPALANLANWVLTHIPQIKAGLVTVTAAIVAYKVATIAAEVAQKGLKGALLATEAAQKLLNIAQAATPWGLVAVGVTAVVTAMVAFSTASAEAVEGVNVLTEEEKALIEQSREAAQAFRDQKAATQETMGGIQAQMGHVQSLADELKRLADESGRVKENDQARVQFILNELNEALGTEYQLTDGVIQKYDQLKTSIDQVIASKTANALLEVYNADYVAAIQAEQEALEALKLVEQDAEAQRERFHTRRTEITKEVKTLEGLKAEAVRNGSTDEIEYYSNLILQKKQALKEEEDLLAEKEEAYTQAASDYGNYEDAMKLAAEGNYEGVRDILVNKGQAFGTYSDDVDEATKRAINALEKEAIDAGIKAAKTKANFEKGVNGYTKKMVEEAEQSYEDALNEWATAYDDANAVGTDLGDGLKAGMEGTKGGLITKARNIVSGIIAAMREEADSNSPAKKLIAFGEDMGAGTEIGLENMTPDLLKTARKQTQELITTYKTEGEDFAPDAFRGVAERAYDRNAAQMESFIGGNNTLLGEILAAIKEGQVLLLDGKTLVGGTSDRMDTELGQLRALVARGAR